jgi:hypothetical protein
VPGSKAWWNGWATRRGRRFFGNRRRVRDAILEDADTLNEETVPDDDGFLDFVNALNEDGMDEDEEDMTDFAALPNILEASAAGGVSVDSAAKGGISGVHSIYA